MTRLIMPKKDQPGNQDIDKISSASGKYFQPDERGFYTLYSVCDKDGIPFSHRLIRISPAQARRAFLNSVYYKTGIMASWAYFTEQGYYLAQCKLKFRPLSEAIMEVEKRLETLKEFDRKFEGATFGDVKDKE